MIAHNYQFPDVKTKNQMFVLAGVGRLVDFGPETVYFHGAHFPLAYTDAENLGVILYGLGEHQIDTLADYEVVPELAL